LINSNPHDAAHALLKLERRASKFPELVALRPALTLATTKDAGVKWDALRTSGSERRL